VRIFFSLYQIGSLFACRRALEQDHAQAVEWWGNRLKLGRTAFGVRSEAALRLDPESDLRGPFCKESGSIPVSLSFFYFFLSLLISH
jgi:hypothetical protein